MRGAVAVAAAMVLGLLALTAPIETLAEVTSTVLLMIFVVMNAALIALKHRGPPPACAPNAPIFVPVLALFAAIALLAFG